MSIARTVTTLATFALFGVAAQAAGNAARATPEAIINLSTREGVAAVNGTWRYAEVALVPVNHRRPGPDRKASGEPVSTFDYEPQAGAADFDDRAWDIIDPATLTDRRSIGRVCQAWYRINITIPEQVGGRRTAGKLIVFETVVDDYAEIWVNGKLPQVLGQVGGPLVAGWNAPNRVVLTRNAEPGETFQIALFAINGPVSESPANFIWIRSATLDVYDPAAYTGIRQVPVDVERLDPALDAIVPRNPKLEKLAEGFRFTEGPIWVRDGGYLLFSDPNNNVIYRWTEDGDVSVYRTKSGYAGENIGEYGQPGSNGLTLDQAGRLTVCEHGNHRISRIEKNGVVTVLADAYEGKRLNSPNDLVYRSDGALYFSDPPFGLPRFHDDPRKELPFEGVFCLHHGALKLVSQDLTGPNGLAFSPDEKYLYVGNWDASKKVVMRYESLPDGSLTNGAVFFDMAAAPGDEAIDGVKVDVKGNVYVSGPGGLWVISPEGNHLGTIRGPELAANMAWGDDDGRTLYLTARTGLYRMRLHVAGIRP
jgi:gluconolactonase